MVRPLWVYFVMTVLLVCLLDVRRVAAMSLEVTPLVTARVIFNDNIFTASDPASDLEMVLSPTLTVRLSYPRGETRFSYGFDYRELLRHDEVGIGVSHGVHFDSALDLSPRLRVSFVSDNAFVSDTRAFYSQGLGSRIVSAFIPRAGLLVETADADIGLAYEVTPVSALQANLSRAELEYSAPGLLDLDTDAGSLRYLFTVTPIDAWGVAYTFSRSKGVGFLSEVQGLTLSYTASLRPTSTLGMGGGGNLLIKDGRVYASYSVSIEEALRRGSLAFSSSRSLGAAGGEAAVDVLSDHYTIRGGYYFTENIEGSVVESYRVSRAITGAPARVIIAVTAASLVYRFAADVLFSLSVDHTENRTVEGAGVSFRINHIIAVVTWEGPTWR